MKQKRVKEKKKETREQKRRNRWRKRKEAEMLWRKEEYMKGGNTVIPVDTESKHPKIDIEKAGSTVKKLKNLLSVSTARVAKGKI